MALEPQLYFDPDSQPHFVHEPLHDPLKSIRLLRLYPGHGEQQLRASLEVCELDGKQEYDALSYMWATKEPRQLIQVSGMDFLLRPSIHSFLLRLRLPDKPRMLWLDSVCIDQNNIDERSHQVSLMGAIYRSCHECHAWLGDADNREDEVIEVFRRNPFDMSGMTDLNLLVRQLHHRDLTDAFKKIMNNPYWSRTWMIQETALPEKVIMHCGDSSCPLDLIPTQIRGRMFEFFFKDRVQYQRWLRVFKPGEEGEKSMTIPTSNFQMKKTYRSSNGIAADLFSSVIGYSDAAQQNNCYLGFTTVNDRSRWAPVIVEPTDGVLEANIHADTGAGFQKIISIPVLSVVSNVSLSTLSDLSFSTEGFNPEHAFRAIEAIFWCINDTSSERLLNERRRYITVEGRGSAVDDFRNFLEVAGAWGCSDIRDRVFGALGVFKVWPRSYSFKPDYRLSAENLLLEVIDYCRPRDPFKLTLKLLKTLNVDAYACARNPKLEYRNSMTLRSRIAWPMSLFHADLVPFRVADGRDYRVLRISRSDGPVPSHMFLYLTQHDDHASLFDEVACIGEAGAVVGLRKKEGEMGAADTYLCVGIGFDISLSTFSTPVEQTETVVDSVFESESIVPHKILQYFSEMSVLKADPADKDDNGDPIVWWIQIPTQFFWWLCQREVKRRAVTVDDEENISGNIMSTGDDEPCSSNNTY